MRTVRRYESLDVAYGPGSFGVFGSVGFIKTAFLRLTYITNKHTYIMSRALCARCAHCAHYSIPDLRKTPRRPPLKGTPLCSVIAVRRIQMRNQIWPSEAQRLWHRKTEQGYSTIPRTLPLLMT